MNRYAYIINYTAQPFGEDGAMLRTIVLGSCVSVQGTFVRALEGGKIAVRVGDQIFAGKPVKAKAA